MDIRNVDGTTPLHNCGVHVSPSVAKAKHIMLYWNALLRHFFQVLLRHGADVDKENEDRRTPLHDASRYGHTEVVKVAFSLFYEGANLQRAFRCSSRTVQISMPKIFR